MSDCYDTKDCTIEDVIRAMSEQYGHPGIDWKERAEKAEATAKEWKERAEKAEANYRRMVERAADQKLDGYRELGGRAAAAEERADSLAARVKELEGALAAIRDELRSRDWLCPGGGWANYDYTQRTTDSLRSEFGMLFNSIEGIVSKALERAREP